MDPILRINPPVAGAFGQLPTLPITQPLDQAQALVTQLRSQVDACLTGCLQEQANVLGNICGCVEGCFDNYLNAALAVLGKIGQKVDGYLMTIFSNAYAIAQQAHCNLPSPQDIIAADPPGVLLTTAPGTGQLRVLGQSPTLGGSGGIESPVGPVGGGEGSCTPPVGQLPNVVWQLNGQQCYGVGWINCPPQDTTGHTIPGTWTLVYYPGTQQLLSISLVGTEQYPWYTQCNQLTGGGGGGGCDVNVTCPPGEIPGPDCSCVSDTITTGGGGNDTVQTGGGGNDTCCPMTCPTPTVTVNVAAPDLSCLCPAGTGNDTTQLSDWPDYPQDWQAPNLSPGYAPRQAAQGSTLEQSLCGIIPQLVQMFATIGQSVLDQNVMTSELFSDIESVMHSLPKEITDLMGSKLEAINNWRVTQFINGQYDQVVGLIDDCDTATVKNLLACKQLFLFLGTLSISIAEQGGIDGKFGTQFQPNIPILNLGAGESFQMTKSSSDVISGTYPVFTLPLSDLLDMCIRYTCSTGLPGIGNAISAWLAGAIDDDHFTCLVSANGGSAHDWQLIAEGQRTKVDQASLVSGLWRQQIQPDQFYQQMRQLGWTEQSEVDQFVAAQYSIANAGDISAVMARGAVRSDVVAKYGLGDEFDAAYQPDVSAAAQANGIPDSLVSARWQAHWRHPGAGELAQMLHRLRPDKQDVVAQNLEFTQDDFNESLSLNDVPPYYRDRLRYITYRTLPRMAANRLLVAGVVDAQAVNSSYLDQGFNQATAQQMTELAQWQQRQALRKEQSLKLYGDGGMNRSEATQMLTAEGYPDDMIAEEFSRQGQLLDAENQAQCIASIGKKFVAGGIPPEQIGGLFAGFGLDQDQATRMLNRWSCEQASMDKVIGASQLCGWYQDGLLDVNTFATRLAGMGYRPQDVQTIVATCISRKQVALQKEEQKARDKNQKQLDKQLAQQQRQQQQQQRQQDKEQRTQDSLNKAANRQQGQITKLVDTASKHYGTLPQDLMGQVTTLRQSLMDYHQLTESIANDILIVALSGIPSKPTVDFPTWVNDAVISYFKLGQPLSTE